MGTLDLEKRQEDKLQYFKDHIEEQIFFQKVLILFENTSFSLLASFLCGTILFFALLDTEQGSNIKYWYAGLIVITVLRMNLTILYFKKPHHTKQFYQLFILGTLISAIFWAIAGTYLFPAGLMEQMVTIIMIAGVSAGGIQSLHPSRFTCSAFCSILVFPLCIVLLLHNTTVYLFIGFALALYLSLLLVLGWRAHNLLSKSLKLHYENMFLAQELTISNSELQHSNLQLRQHEHDILLINKMNERLQHCENSKQAYKVIQKFAQRIFIHVNGSLAITNQQSGELVVVERWGDTPIKSRFSQKSCESFNKSNLYVVNSFNKKPFCQHFTRLAIHTSVCIPLMKQQTVLGLLNFNAQEKISHYYIQLMTTFADNIDMALANLELREALLEQVIRDPLTGLYNRRYLDETLERELKRILRENNSLCVVMFDIDHFKEFNDQNGHEAGDEALKFIGFLAKKMFRENDIVCRFGGEEFIIILINTTLTHAYPRLEAFREEIKNAKLYFMSQQLPGITVSMGAAQAPDHGVQADVLINAADKALYAAKQQGRNRLILAELSK